MKNWNYSNYGNFDFLNCCHILYVFDEKGEFEHILYTSMYPLYGNYVHH